MPIMVSGTANILSVLIRVPLGTNTNKKSSKKCFSFLGAFFVMVGLHIPVRRSRSGTDSPEPVHSPCYP